MRVVPTAAHHPAIASDGHATAGPDSAMRLHPLLDRHVLRHAPRDETRRQDGFFDRAIQRSPQVRVAVRLPHVAPRLQQRQASRIAVEAAHGESGRHAVARTASPRLLLRPGQLPLLNETASMVRRDQHVARIGRIKEGEPDKLARRTMPQVKPFGKTIGVAAMQPPVQVAHVQRAALPRLRRHAHEKCTNALEVRRTVCCDDDGTARSRPCPPLASHNPIAGSHQKKAGRDPLRNRGRPYCRCCCRYNSH